MIDQLKALGVVSPGMVALVVAELPIDDLAKLGVAGGCLGLVWWMIARSLPQISQSHNEALKVITTTQMESLGNLTAAYRQAIADLRTLHHETTSEVVAALGGVKAEIKAAADAEAALLRELIKDKHSR